MLFIVHLIFYISVFYVVENTSEKGPDSLEGVVKNIVTTNTGFDFYVSNQYFNINKNSFYCISDISKLKTEETVTVSYLQVDVLGVSYKCVRSIREASL